MAKALIVPPAGLPVTLAQVKQHLRIDTADEDAYLLELAASATAAVEAACGKALLSQTWRVYLDELPACALMELPVSPVLSVAAVTAYGADGNPSAVSPTAFRLDRVSDPARLLFVTRPDAPNGIEIDVVAGYGEAGADVPDQLVRAILVLCAHWHAFRGSANDAALMGTFPRGFDALLAPFRRARL
jgi:uncharacterized phiE125 gp8 family phage protein